MGSKTLTVQARAGQRRRAATQQDLMDATKRLLEAGAPMAGLSIADIVAEAGVARTTFYLHFRDKSELIEALAREQVEWIEDAGRLTSTDPSLSRETVGRSISEIVANWAENQAVLSAIIEVAEHDLRMREMWLGAINDVASVAGEMFAAQWANYPDLAPEDPEMIAEVLSWMIERSCHQIARDPGRREAVAASMSEVIWRVLHPQTP